MERFCPKQGQDLKPLAALPSQSTFKILLPPTPSTPYTPLPKNFVAHCSLTGLRREACSVRGGEWYLEKLGSRKILAGSRNLRSVFEKSRSLVSAWFVFTFFESRNFLPKSLGLGFLTRISAFRRVSDFTIPHPFCLYFVLVRFKVERMWGEII